MMDFAGRQFVFGVIIVVGVVANQREIRANSPRTYNIGGFQSTT
jgi:hypothetical protein